MTDLKQVLPRLQLALKINCRGQNAAVRKLEWGKPTDEEQIMEELEQVLPDVNPRKIHPRSHHVIDNTLFRHCIS